MDRRDDIIALLDTYLAGTGTPEDQARAEAYVHARPRLRARLAELRQAVGHDVPTSATFLAYASVRTQLLDRIIQDVEMSAHADGETVQERDGIVQERDGRESTSVSHVSPERTLKRKAMRTDVRMATLARPVQWRALPYALALVVIGILGIVLGRYTQTAGNSARQDIVPTRYATGKGQRANITLSDGTTVVLNVDSRLEVPADYVRGNRALQLTGEALFSVAHRSKTTFTVQSGGVTTRVLGTNFVVRHYPSDTTTVVAVRDGKVGIRSLVLSAGEQSEITSRSATHVHPYDSAAFTFASGVLTLEDMSLSSAIPELNRWYDLDIRLGDPKLATRKVWGGFNAGAQSDMIAIFEGGMNLRVVREGRTLTLFPRSGL